MLSIRPSTIRPPSLVRAYLKNSILAGGASLLGLLFSLDVFYSVLAGWLCWFIPTLWHAKKAWQGGRVEQPLKMVQRLYQATVGKYVLTGAVCVMVFTFYPKVSPGIFFLTLLLLQFTGLVLIHWQLQTSVNRQKGDH